MSRRLFRKLLLLLMLVQAAGLLFATDLELLYQDEHRLDESGREIIRSLVTEDAMIADYTQTRSIKRLSRTLTSSGRVYILPGSGMVWHTLKPYESIMVVGRSSMKQQIGGGRTSTMDVSGNQIYLSVANALESIFSGSAEEVEENFEVWYLEEDGAWIFGLVPREEVMRSFMARLEVTGSSDFESLTLTEASGETIRYEFSDVERRELESDEAALFRI